MQRRVPTFYLGLAVITIIFFLLLLLPLPFLVAADQDHHPVLIFPLLMEKKFSLGYVHSVHKTPVEESFTVSSGNRLVLTSTSFDDLGVGIPFDRNEGRLVNQNDRFLLTDINRQFKEINLRAVPLAQQSITFKNRLYAFNVFFASGSPIRLKAVNYTTAQLLWHKISTAYNHRITVGKGSRHQTTKDTIDRNIL